MRMKLIIFSKNLFFSDSSRKPDYATIHKLFSLDSHNWQSLMRAEIEQFTLVINLLKQDRFGMRFSLEGRVPLVSRKVLEFASSLPFEKIIGSINKDYLIKYSKTKIIKKKPFSVFANPEYKNILNNLCRFYVNKNSVSETKILEWPKVKSIIEQIDKGSLLSIKKAMSILVFMVWWKNYKVYLR